MSAEVLQLITPTSIAASSRTETKHGHSGDLGRFSPSSSPLKSSEALFKLLLYALGAGLGFGEYRAGFMLLADPEPTKPTRGGPTDLHLRAPNS